MTHILGRERAYIHKQCKTPDLLDAKSLHLVRVIMPNRDDFRDELYQVFTSISKLCLSFVGIASGDLHRLVGSYPGEYHRMPVCCDVMNDEMMPDDEILQAPPKGKGATLIVRYRLPRA